MKVRRKFKCSGCGACCRNIGGITELGEYDLGNGVCKFLDQETNKCKIYDSRPLVCRVDDFYDKYKEKLGMSRSEWYKKNHEACKKLKEK